MQDPRPVTQDPTNQLRGSAERASASEEEARRLELRLCAFVSFSVGFATAMVLMAMVGYPR